MIQIKKLGLPGNHQKKKKSTSSVYIEQEYLSKYE